MADLANYLETNVLEWAFQNDQMPTPPASVFVALHTSDPGEDADVGELTAASYGRVEVAAPGGWTLTGGVVENAAEVAFGTAGETWGTVSHFSLHDGSDPATSNALAKSALNTAKTIEANDELRFDAGALTATLD